MSYVSIIEQWTSYSLQLNRPANAIIHRSIKSLRDKSLIINNTNKLITIILGNYKSIKSQSVVQPQTQSIDDHSCWDQCCAMFKSQEKLEAKLKKSLPIHTICISQAHYKNWNWKKTTLSFSEWKITFKILVLMEGCQREAFTLLAGATGYFQHPLFLILNSRLKLQEWEIIISVLYFIKREKSNL